MKIDEMIKKYKKLKKERDYLEQKKIDKIKSMQIEFFNMFKELGQKVVAFGNPFYVETEIILGLGKKEVFRLKLSPYEQDDFLLLGDFNVLNENGTHVYISFNPDIEPCDYLDKKDLYITVLPFVMLQIYDKKEELYNKMYNQIIEDIGNHITLQEELIRIIEENID